jgi:hypothetical protein
MCAVRQAPRTAMVLKEEEEEESFEQVHLTHVARFDGCWLARLENGCMCEIGTLNSTAQRRKTQADNVGSESDTSRDGAKAKQEQDKE